VSANSSVPGVRTWLLQVLSAAVEPFTSPTVEVFLSQPDHETANDLVVIGAVHRQTPTVRFVGGGGPMWQDEIYTIDIEIACFLGGAAAFPDVDLRAYQVLVACEQAIRADPSANGQVVVIHPEGSDSSHEWDEGGEGGHCNIAMIVSVCATY
jgi:hypothetical protein